MPRPRLDVLPRRGLDVLPRRKVEVLPTSREEFPGRGTGTQKARLDPKAKVYGMVPT